MTTRKSQPDAMMEFEPDLDDAPLDLEHFDPLGSSLLTQQPPSATVPNALSDRLSREIVVNPSTTVYLAIVQLNQRCQFPFWQFLVETKTHVFPKVQETFREDEDPVVVMNACLTQVLALFPALEPYFGAEVQEHMFKGVIHDDNLLYILFQPPPVGLCHCPDNHRWDLMNDTGGVVGEERDSILTRFFTRFEEEEIVTSSLHPYYRVVYLAEPDADGTWRNITRTQSQQRVWDAPSVHSWLGEAYYFTSQPLKANQDPVDMLQPYVVFIVRDQYLVQDVANISAEQRQAFDAKYQEVDYLTLYYRENGIQWWCVKSPMHFVAVT